MAVVDKTVSTVFAIKVEDTVVSSILTRGT